MKLQKLKFLFVLLLILGLNSCFSGGDDKNNNKNIQSTSNLNEEKKEEENSFINIDNETLEKYISKEEIKNFDENINNGDFSKSNETIDLVFEKLIEKKELTPADKKLKTGLTYIKVGNILNEGNYLYKEKESNKKAIEILESKESFLTDYIDPFYHNYYLGYAKEITKDYSGALNNYNIALESAQDISKNKNLRSIILNQIGHVYDLSGDIEKAYKYYLDAYKIDNNNYYSSINIARYLSRKGDIKNAKKFFIFGLNTNNKLLKSEIYFSLSSLELELNGLKLDIEKSIEYAKKSIESYSNYPMGYVALARGYYMLNDSKYDKLIEENLNIAIKLNPNNTLAYRYYGLYLYDKKKYDEMGKKFEEAIKATKYDMILMDNSRKNEKFLIENIYGFLLIIKTFDKNENNMKNLEITYNKKEFNNLFKTQLKRKNFGIFSFFKENKDFNNLFNK